MPYGEVYFTDHDVLALAYGKKAGASFPIEGPSGKATLHRKGVCRESGPGQAEKPVGQDPVKKLLDPGACWLKVEEDGKGRA